MNLKEIKEMRELLLEANFKEINLMDYPEELEKYYTANEIGRRLDVRLDGETINKAMVSLGYKTFHNKVGLPSDPENSAFLMKYIEDEKTNEKKYYIQCLWKKEELLKVNKAVNSDATFNEHKNKIISENNKIISDKLKEFKKLDNYVVFSVKKTGFNLKKDFVIYIAYSIFKKGSGIVGSGNLLINDDLDEEKTKRYLEENEFTGMSPFDYCKINIPTMDDCSYSNLFMDRRDALRTVYKIVKGNNVIFYNKHDEKFIERMFQNEEIPYDHTYENIINSSLSFRDLIDWLEPKESLKIKDVYSRYNIIKNKTHGFQDDAIMLNNAIIKVLERY